MESYVVNNYVVESFLKYIFDFNKDLDHEESVCQYEFVKTIIEEAKKGEGQEDVVLMDTTSVVSRSLKKPMSSN